MLFQLNPSAALPERTINVRSEVCCAAPAAQFVAAAWFSRECTAIVIPPQQFDCDLLFAVKSQLTQSAFQVCERVAAEITVTISVLFRAFRRIAIRVRQFVQSARYLPCGSVYGKIAILRL